MTLTGNEPHGISLTEAAQMTKNFRNTITTGQTIAHCFGQDAVQNIIDQTGCVGIRIYYGLDNNGAQQLILVGVDTNGNDLYNGLLAERAIKCPQSCSSANPLNSDATG